MMERVPFSEPWLTQAEQDAVAQVVASGRLVMGPQVREFERLLASYCGRRFAVAVSSGTAALELSLRAHGVGPGWEVLVPAYTWVATYNVALMVGARPRLVDVNEATFCMDEGALEQALAMPDGGRRRCVMPVHLFGYRALERWLAEQAEARGLLVIGDGCCAFGGRTSDGRRCGAWAPVECLSFHPRKVLTTGEGGAILTDDEVLAARLSRLRDHGAQRSDEQRGQTRDGGPMVPEFPEPGSNARMTELQGALGRAQMERVEELVGGRQEAARRYDGLLRARGWPWLVAPPGEGDEGRVLTMYVVRVVGRDDVWRRAWMQGCAQRGVALRPPMVSLDGLAWAADGREGRGFEGTRRLVEQAVGLPLYAQISEAAQRRVVEVMSEVADGLDG
jgi:perosamine synthetase